jgi:hypothetical protein
MTRRLLTFLVIILSGVAFAQTGPPGNPSGGPIIPGSVLTYEGPTYGAVWELPQSGGGCPGTGCQFGLGLGLTRTPGSDNITPLRVGTADILYGQTYDTDTTSTSYTFLLTDAAHLKTFSAVVPQTATFPPSGGAGFEKGNVFCFLVTGSGGVTFATSGGVFKGVPLSSGTFALAQYGNGCIESSPPDWLVNAAIPASVPPAITCAVLPGGGCPFDIHIAQEGVPANSQKINVPINRAVSCPAGFAGSFGFASTASTGTAVVTVNQITGGVPTARGTITFTASTTGVPASGAGMTLAANDVVQFVMPVSADATLADFGIGLKCTRS